MKPIKEKAAMCCNTKAAHNMITHIISICDYIQKLLYEQCKNACSFNYLNRITEGGSNNV
jgi:hypothetical protein